VVLMPFVFARRTAPLGLAGAVAADDSRGAGRPVPRAARPPRHPGGVRLLRLRAGPARRAAAVRHGRARPGHARQRPDGAPVSPPVPGRGWVHLPAHPGRARHAGIPHGAVAGHCSRVRRSSSTRPAGSRDRSPPRSTSSPRTSPRSRCSSASSRPTCPWTRRAWRSTLPRGRSRRDVPRCPPQLRNFRAAAVRQGGEPVRWKEWLDRYEDPGIDEAVDEASGTSSLGAPDSSRTPELGEPSQGAAVAQQREREEPERPAGRCCRAASRDQEQTRPALRRPCQGSQPIVAARTPHSASA